MTQPEKAYTAMLDDNEERNRIIMEELPQVTFAAKRIYERLPQHVPFEDLVQAGVLGLLDAVRTFDASKGVQLKAFAQFRIRGAILDSLRDLDWGPRRLRRQRREIDEKLYSLEKRLGRQPSEEELAAELGVAMPELYSILTQLDGLELTGQVESAYDTDNHDLIESAPSNGSDNPFELCAGAEMKEHLTRAMATLNERERMVISLYYKDELTMREVAEVLQVGQSRVSQLHSLALSKLNARLRRFGSMNANVRKHAGI